MRMRAGWAAGVLCTALAWGWAPGSRHVELSAVAQSPGQRVVAGVVVNATDSGPEPGATVFLRNSKTKSIRSYTATSNGRFRFAQVDMSEDYDLWAEKDGKKSAVKTVSSWDTRKEFECELKIK